MAFLYAAVPLVILVIYVYQRKELSNVMPKKRRLRTYFIIELISEMLRGRRLLFFPSKDHCPSFGQRYRKAAGFKEIIYFENISLEHAVQISVVEATHSDTDIIYVQTNVDWNVNQARWKGSCSN